MAQDIWYTSETSQTIQALQVVSWIIHRKSKDLYNVSGIYFIKNVILPGNSAMCWDKYSKSTYVLSFVPGSMLYFVRKLCIFPRYTAIQLQRLIKRSIALLLYCCIVSILYSFNMYLIYILLSLFVLLYCLIAVFFVLVSDLRIIPSGSGGEILDLDWFLNYRGINSVRQVLA